MRSAFVVCVLLLFASCQTADNHGHSHDDSGGHGHSHGDETLVDYTFWTEQTELFVEFPALTVDKISRFAAHFTHLEGHQPIQEGSVTVSLIKGGKGIRQTVDAPSSPGIFTPSLQPKEAGNYQLIFDLTTPAYTDRIVLDNIQVHATDEEAQASLADDGEDNSISFLKEQAWKMAFQTTPVMEKETYQVIKTYGIWRVAPADDQVLVAPASGVLRFKPTYFTEGMEIETGQVLMEISSSDLTTNNLRSEVEKAKAVLDQREASYERITKLYERKISPKSEVEKAKEEYLVAKANYETLAAGYTGKGKQVTAPFNGYILEMYTKNGEYTAQGDPLIKVTIDQNHMLQTMINPDQALEVNEVHDVKYQNGDGQWSSLNATGGKVISISREVSLDNPSLSLFSEVEESIHLPDGSFTEVMVEVGEPRQSIVIPSSALLEDYGQYSVIVQLSGESFERRNVTTGNRNGKEVEIIRGLSKGEIVVSKGAFQVKMAALSDQAPAHGHAH
ncbi:MAG: efflux RND transporter periplasmic adaptor subunit [Bacteroidota bacterium]